MQSIKQIVNRYEDNLLFINNVDTFTINIIMPMKKSVSK